MPRQLPTLEGPLTGPLDLRSQPDQLTSGTLRMRQNFQTIANGVLRRGTGFEKFLNSDSYNNADFHDQLLSLSGGVRSPVTMMFEAESTRRIRSLIISNQGVVASINQHSQNYRILGSGFGGPPTSSGTAPRFKAAKQGDYVLLTNNYDEVKYMVLEQPPTGGNYLFPVDDLAIIGLSKAAVIWEWRSCIFLADVVMDGTRYSYRLLWSDFDHPTGFDPEQLDSITGFKDLESYEQILAGVPAGNSFLIYTTHGIWEMAAVGGQQSFDFRRVYNGEKDKKKAVLAYPNAIANLHDKHVYLGHDGIYMFNQYFTSPDRPEWLHKASADLMARLDSSVCDPHVAGAFGDEVLFSVATRGAVNQLPDYTLRANKTYEACDVVDHGFACFSQFSPQDVPTIRDFIVENGICTLAGLLAAGYGYGNEGLPSEPIETTAPFPPDCIYTKTRKEVTLLTYTTSSATTDTGTTTKSEVGTETVYVEDYTLSEADATSLCAVLAGARIVDICKDCEGTPLFLAVSVVDWCIKQLGEVFSRELCSNTTAVGTTDDDGYTSAIGFYALSGITSLLRFPPLTAGPDQLVSSDSLQLDFVPVQTSPQLNISLRVGVSAQTADPNIGTAMVWHQFSSKPLAYSTTRNQAQHLAAGTQPSDTLAWQYEMKGRILYFELTIAGIGGDSTFSRIAAGIQGAGRTLNY